MQQVIYGGKVIGSRRRRNRVIRRRICRNCVHCRQVDPFDSAQGRPVDGGAPRVKCGRGHWPKAYALSTVVFGAHRMRALPTEGEIVERGCFEAANPTGELYWVWIRYVMIPWAMGL